MHVLKVNRSYSITGKLVSLRLLFMVQFINLHFIPITLKKADVGGGSQRTRKICHIVNIVKFYNMTDPWNDPWIHGTKR